MDPPSKTKFGGTISHRSVRVKYFGQPKLYRLRIPIIAQHKLCLVVQHIARTSYFRARRAQYTTPGWSSSPSARVCFREPGSAAPAETFRQSRDRPTTRGQPTRMVWAGGNS